MLVIRGTKKLRDRVKGPVEVGPSDGPVGRAEPYDYDLDGRSTIIADAWTATVEVRFTGSTDATVTDIHLHPTPEGARWLTHCGDPV